MPGWPRRWPSPACCRLATSAWWRCLATKIFVPCLSTCISRSVYRSQDGAVTALLLLLLCFFTLFSVIENLRGAMLKLNDVTWLYQHLPMRFTLSVEHGERIAVLTQRGREKHAAEPDCRFFYPPPAAVSTSTASLIPTRRPRVVRYRCCFRKITCLTTHNPPEHCSGNASGLKLNPEQNRPFAGYRRTDGDRRDRTAAVGELSGGQRQRAALARCLVRAGAAAG